MRWLFLCIFFFESAFAQIDVKDLYGDNVKIYDKGEMTSNVVGTIEFFDSPSLTGQPVFSLSSNSLENVRNKKKINFSDKNNFKNTFPFIAEHGGRIYLIIVGIRKGIARVRYNSNDLFFSFDKNKFKDIDSTTVWRKSFKTSENLTRLRKTFEKEQGLRDLLLGYIDCLEKQDIECFIKKLSPSDQSNIKYHLKKYNVLKTSCNEIVGQSTSIDLLVEKANIVHIPWKLLIDTFKIGKGLKVTHEVQDFGEKSVYYMDNEALNECDYPVELKIKLIQTQNPEKWSMEFISLIPN